MPKSVLAVDIDGVINDYFSTFIRHCNNKFNKRVQYEDCTTHDLNDIFNINTDEYAKTVIEYEKNLEYKDQVLIKDAVQTLRELEKYFKIISITGRREILRGVTEELFSKHIPFVDLHFAIGRNNAFSLAPNRIHKTQLAEQLGASYLIDDNDYEFIHWDSETVKPICFAQPWNKVLEKSHPHIPRLQWKGIKKHLMDNISKANIS